MLFVYLFYSALLSAFVLLWLVCLFFINVFCYCICPLASKFCLLAPPLVVFVLYVYWIPRPLPFTFIPVCIWVLPLPFTNRYILGLFWKTHAGVWHFLSLFSFVTGFVCYNFVKGVEPIYIFDVDLCFNLIHFSILICL